LYADILLAEQELSSMHNNRKGNRYALYFFMKIMLPLHRSIVKFKINILTIKSKRKGTVTLEEVYAGYFPLSTVVAKGYS